MARIEITNNDKILQIVLNDSILVEYGKYNPSEYETIEDALNSQNAIVVAVAKMISGLRRSYTEREIYNEVSSYLKNNIL